MATLYEYFLKDTSTNLSVGATWPIKDQATGAVLLEISVNLMLDFDANAKYVVFYFPLSDKVECPEAIALNQLANALRFNETTVASVGIQGTQSLSSDALIFTGRVFLYSERPVEPQLRDRMLQEAARSNHHLVFRSTEYTAARNKWEKPLAFISHDSRDKANIAQPLALEMQRILCPVWFDEFSLTVGDSLRESIESGLKQCRKCILVLTPNFLANGGWTKREYDSIFTRELIEKEKVILPIWDGVTPKEIYEYSPILADRVALQWSLGKEQVAGRLRAAIETT